MIAILGATGMLGKEFVARLSETSHEFRIFDRSNLNIDDNPNDLARSLCHAEFVINCIAYTNVPGAEANRDLAMAVNAEFPTRLAMATSATGARLIHFSTDYVFDGMNSVPYSTSDLTRPVNAYGISKACGEKGISEFADNFRILRTSWLYGGFGMCFPKKIQSMLAAGMSPRIVSDQIGQPTWAADVVEFTLSELPKIHDGKIVHAASSGSGSWFDFSQEIAASIHPDLVSRLIPISSGDFVDSVNRPKYSVLDVTDNVAFQIGDWKNRWHVAGSKVLD
jgi:dTDP-4-dehydrorhamnose reductase